MSSERSYWFCSKCGKYSDPQSLDYNTGMCWDCEDGVIDSNMNTREPPAWAIEDALEYFFNTEVDNPSLDLMAYGYDADAASQVYWALGWLHEKELKNS